MHDYELGVMGQNYTMESLECWRAMDYGTAVAAPYYTMELSNGGDACQVASAIKWFMVSETTCSSSGAVSGERGPWQWPHGLERTCASWRRPSCRAHSWLVRA